MSGAHATAKQSLASFQRALDKFPEGYSEGLFGGHLWGVTVRRSADTKRIWLYAEALAGTDIVSFNFYRLTQAGPTLKPCEMSSSKVQTFVIGFIPGKGVDRGTAAAR